eukprot:2832145-Rhodomonas_salina.6
MPAGFPIGSMRLRPCSLESKGTIPALSLRLVWLPGTVQTEAVGTRKSTDDSCRPQTEFGGANNAGHTSILQQMAGCPGPVNGV